MCIRDSHKERTEHPWLRHVEPQQESGRAGTDPPFYQCSLWPDNGFRCVYLSLAARSGRSHQVWRGTLASEEVQDSGYAVLALNDSWPVFSWSSVDYFKRPKALYYYTRRFYADILPIVRYEPSDKAVSVTVVNDRYEDTLVDMALEIWDTGGTKVWEKKYDGLRLPRDSVSTVDLITMDEIPARTLSDMVVHVRVVCGDQQYDC